MKFRLFFILLLLIVSQLYADEAINNKQFETDLKPLIKSFKKQLSKQLNKNNCEKKVFIKKASLNTSNNLISVKLRTRIKRQYCTRRAKAKVFEKSGDLVYNFSIQILNNKLKAVNDENTKNLKSFEKSFTDVLSTNSENKIADIIIKLIEAEIAKNNLASQTYNGSTYLKSVRVNAQEQSLIITYE